MVKISFKAFLRCRETKLCHTMSELWLFEATIFYLQRGKSAFTCFCFVVLYWLESQNCVWGPWMTEYFFLTNMPIHWNDLKRMVIRISNRTWSQGRIPVREEASFIGGAAVSFMSNSKCKKSKTKFNTQLTCEIVWR